MKIKDHVEKAERIENSMKTKLDVHADYETVIENCMLAGTHYLNAVLHAKGVTEETFDVLHSDKPKFEKPDGDELLNQCLANMKYIEDLRPYHVRGVDPYREEVGTSSIDAFEKVKSYCLNNIK